VRLVPKQPAGPPPPRIAQAALARANRQLAEAPPWARAATRRAEEAAWRRTDPWATASAPAAPAHKALGARRRRQLRLAIAHGSVARSFPPPRRSLIDMALEDLDEEDTGGATSSSGGAAAPAAAAAAAASPPAAAAASPPAAVIVVPDYDAGPSPPPHDEGDGDEGEDWGEWLTDAALQAGLQGLGRD